MTTKLIPGFVIEGTLIDFAIIAVIFTLVQKLVKPLISLMLLPLHFVTLGTISWAVNLITLYGLTFFVAKVKLIGFAYVGLSTSLFVIPPLTITPFFCALLTSFSLGIIGAVLHWLME